MVGVRSLQKQQQKSQWRSETGRDKKRGFSPSLWSSPQNTWIWAIETAFGFLGLFQNWNNNRFLSHFIYYCFRFEIESQLRSSNQPGTHPLALADLKFSVSPASSLSWDDSMSHLARLKFLLEIKSLCRFISTAVKKQIRLSKVLIVAPPLRDKRAWTVGLTQPVRPSRDIDCFFWGTLPFLM